MSNKNQTVNEAQLKARRTSLGKKSKEELITIILRKDNTERSLNTKVQELIKQNNELNTQNADLSSYSEKIKQLEDGIKVKQELVNAITFERNNFSKEVVRLKYLCNFRRKVIFTLIGIIVILAMLFIIS